MFDLSRLVGSVSVLNRHNIYGITGCGFATGVGG